MQIARKRGVEAAILALVPHIPARDLAEVAAQALYSRGLHTASPEAAAWLSLVSYVRHNFTDYDAMLAEGYGIEAARHFCLDALNAALADWGARRRVSGEAD